MSLKWYPVIDYEKCIRCGACINKCSHGVYENGTDLPKVINPEACIEGCHGCQKLCPAGAIQYFGDTGTDLNSGCCGESSSSDYCSDSDCESGLECDCGSESGCGCGSGCEC